MGGAGFPGININGMGAAGMHGNPHVYGEYDDEYGDEDGPPVDENGDPIRSPEEIKNIINSIPSFKYEEKKGPSEQKEQTITKQQPGKSGTARQEDNKESCAICLDDLKTGQMVKALACSHKFHEKCINNWLKQKLLCPLCKEKIDLNNY